MLPLVGGIYFLVVIYRYIVLRYNVQGLVTEYIGCELKISGLIVKSCSPGFSEGMGMYILSGYSCLSVFFDKSLDAADGDSLAAEREEEGRLVIISLSIEHFRPVLIHV